MQYKAQQIQSETQLEKDQLENNQITVRGMIDRLRYVIEINSQNNYRKYIIKWSFDAQAPKPLVQVGGQLKY